MSSLQRLVRTAAATLPAAGSRAKRDRIEEALRRSRDDLDMRVQVRTAELDSGDKALKSAVEQARQREAEIAVLLQGSRAVLKLHEFAQAVRTLFFLQTLLGAAGGYVRSVEPSLPTPARGLRAETYRTRRMVCRNEFSRTEWMELLPEGYIYFNNVMFVPLRIGEEKQGLLGPANKPGGFTDNDARLVSAFGELVAVSLRNDRLREFLETSEERQRVVLENAADTLLIPERFREAHRHALDRAASTGKPSKGRPHAKWPGSAKTGVNALWSSPRRSGR